MHIHCLFDPVQGRRKSGISDCPVCEEEKGKRLECSGDGSSCIVYYYGNASQTKSEAQEVQCSPVKEEPTMEAAMDSPPPLVERASAVIYYSQTSLE